MSPHDPLEESLAKNWPTAAWSDVPVLLAVSGGADSIALLRAMASLKQDAGGPGQLYVAHLNHQLRGAESDQDQDLVAATCQNLDLPCHLGQANVSQLANQQGDGLEAAARSARYDFLIQTAEKLGARYVVTAHTADDQIETILHRILRGTGLSGISGIPRVRSLSPAVTLIRPLLTTTRVEIETYLKSIDQPYREDASNTDRTFTRNRIRHELVPLLRSEYNPNVDKAIRQLGTLAGEAQSILESLAEELLEKAKRSQTENSIELDTRELANQPRYLVRETLKRVWRSTRWPEQAMSYEPWARLTTLATQPLDKLKETRQILPGNIQADRDGERLRLTRIA